MNVREAALVRVTPEEAKLAPLDLKREASGPPAISAPMEQGGVNHLAMNCIVPGLGSLVRGRTRAGGAQLGLFLAALPMFYFSTLLALAMIVGAYAWSIGSGIGYVRQGSSMRWD